MKTIKVTDCNNNEHNLNVEMIYNITNFKNDYDGKVISVIHLNHKDSEYTFLTFNSYESKASILSRLEQYK